MLISGKSGSRLPTAAWATDGQFAYEPVRSRTRPTRSPSRSTTQVVAPRGLSTRPMPIGASRRRERGRRLHGPVQQPVEQVEGLPQLERALLEPGLHVAGRPPSSTGSNPW